MKMALRLLLCAACVVSARPARANSCDGIWHKSLTQAFALETQKKLPPGSVDRTAIEHPYEHMAVGNWHIIWLSFDHLEPGAHILHVRGKTVKFIDGWGGAAGCDEEGEIEQWALDRAPHFPKKLARCFAWYVTRACHE